MTDLESDPGTLLLISLAAGPKHGHAMLLDVEAFGGRRLGPGTLYGRGTAVKVGRSLAFAEASIEDGDGQLLARAQARFSVAGREPG